MKDPKEKLDEEELSIEDNEVNEGFGNKNWEDKDNGYFK